MWCSRGCLGPPATSVACLWHVSVAGGAGRRGCAAGAASAAPAKASRTLRPPGLSERAGGVSVFLNGLLTWNQDPAEDARCAAEVVVALEVRDDGDLRRALQARARDDEGRAEAAAAVELDADALEHVRTGLE